MEGLVQKQLSVVIPVYNQRKMAEATVRDLHRFLEGLNINFEIIVVDDGSRLTEKIDRHILPRNVNCLTLETNRGKGYAVRLGMMRASGFCRLFTDADCPFPLPLIKDVYESITSRSSGVVVGHRDRRAATVLQGQDWFRLAYSKLFSYLVGSFLPPGISDSQCPLKAFDSEIAEIIWPAMSIDRFAFDIEVLYCLKLADVPVQVIDVGIAYYGSSSVRIARDGFRMSLDILRLIFSKGRLVKTALRVSKSIELRSQGHYFEVA